MKRNGFTLIELLVVVAIIGILAAVGVVAYNGYTTSARASAVKANHKLIAGFLSSEFMKCEMNIVEKILDNKVDCSERDGATIMGHLVNSARKIIKSNPYGAPNEAQGTHGVIIDAAREDVNVGYITINHSGQNIIIKTCFKKPCNIASDENILTDTFLASDRD